MKFETSSLRSKVARRIFLLFISCALVPVGALTLLAFYQVSSQLRDQSRQQLEQATKSQGMSTYQRLEMLDRELQVIAFQMSGGGAAAMSMVRGKHFDGLEIVRDGSARLLLGKGSQIPVLASDQMQHLKIGKSLLKVSNCMGRSCILMIRFLDENNPENGLLSGEINSGYLWDDDRVPSAQILCIFDANGAPLLCSKDGFGSHIQTKPRVSPSSGLFRWSSDGDYDVAYWTLFLNPEFHAASWTFALGQPHADALAPMVRFRNSFPFVMLLALWIVILLSLIQIRRTLGPLEKLTEGTREIRGQNFDTRVEVHSGDEFEHLAMSFNSMSHQLGRSFHALKTINEIDQAILQSLDRNGIVSGVLNHMPYLLPATQCGVAIFDGTLTAAEVIFVETDTSGSPEMLSVQTRLSGIDLETLRQHPHSIVIGPGVAPPDFLAVTLGEEFSSFLILPIFVELKPFAALVCANAKSTAMEAEDVRYARQVADQLAVAFSNVQLIETLEQFHWGTLTALARAIDAKSAWTAGHSERVTSMALRIGAAMGLETKDLQIMQRGGLLHDIGKIGTPPTILDKAGKLDADELKTMRDHVRIGLRILEPIPAFKEAIPIVAQHHEWFNGKGYPEGLAGDAISLHARIFAVADCYDALSSDRPYRQGLPKDRVAKMLKEGSGTQFDPKVVEVFLRVCSQDGADPDQAVVSDVAAISR